ncbi:MAG TPA: cytochrome d ubiquinol oxidase subunit II, partial [Micromonospora sp.]
METLWYALLGLFLAGYLVLGGLDQGVALLSARQAEVPPAGALDHRRLMLNAVGPFLLGNEVWLVAWAGLLIGAFPLLEGELFAALHPVVGVALAGSITLVTAVQLRSRASNQRARGRWDRALVTGGALAATGWGAVLASLLQGVPRHPDGHLDRLTALVNPFVAAGGLALAAVVAVHGAAFLALRLPVGPAERIARSGRRLVPVALVAVGAATVVGLLTEPVRQNARQPLAAVLIPVVTVGALLAARAALGRRRPGLAFAATTAALALPVLLISLATWPYALPSTVDPAGGLTVAEAAAGPATLRRLGWLTFPLLPVLLGVQVLSWWLFRGRIGARSTVFW